MNIVCNFLNEPSVTLENVPQGTRWIYVCYDAASGAPKLVTWDHNEVGRWMADSKRKAPWVEPQEVFAGEHDSLKRGGLTEMTVEAAA